MQESSPSKISWYSSIFVALFLISAAIVKWLQLMTQPFFWGEVLIFFEILAAVLLVIFHRKAMSWTLISLIFAFWLGYDIFWALQKAPGKCFLVVEGVKLGMFLSGKIAVVVLSIINLICLRAAKKRIYMTIFLSFLLVIAGLWLGSYRAYANPSNDMTESPVAQEPSSLPAQPLPPPAPNKTNPSAPLPEPATPAEPSAPPAPANPQLDKNSRPVAPPSPSAPLNTEPGMQERPSTPKSVPPQAGG